MVPETDDDAIVPSSYLGDTLVREVGSPNLTILWDPANGLGAQGRTFSDGCEGPIPRENVHGLEWRDFEDASNAWVQTFNVLNG